MKKLFVSAFLMATVVGFAQEKKATKEVTKHEVTKQEATIKESKPLKKAHHEKKTVEAKLAEPNSHEATATRSSQMEVKPTGSSATVEHKTQKTTSKIGNK